MTLKVRVHDLWILVDSVGVVDTMDGYDSNRPYPNPEKEMKTYVLALVFTLGCFVASTCYAQCDGCSSVMVQSTAPSSIYMNETVNVTEYVPVTRQVQQCAEYRRVECSSTETNRVGFRQRAKARRLARTNKRQARLQTSCNTAC